MTIIQQILRRSNSSSRLGIGRQPNRRSQPDVRWNSWKESYLHNKPHRSNSRWYGKSRNERDEIGFGDYPLRGFGCREKERAVGAIAFSGRYKPASISTPLVTVKLTASSPHTFPQPSRFGEECGRNAFKRGSLVVVVKGAKSRKLVSAAALDSPIRKRSVSPSDKLGFKQLQISWANRRRESAEPRQDVVLERDGVRTAREPRPKHCSDRLCPKQARAWLNFKSV